MSLTAKLAISLVVAVITATLTTVLRTGGLFDPLLLPAFIIATAVTALLINAHRATNSAAATPQGRAAAGQRAQGTVKWFNVSKGFGFIVMDGGEEIFVHFRSIRGEGRRALRDGQRVSFVVAQSDKGPQAEDVVGEG